jgi:hypothetical protein
MPMRRFAIAVSLIGLLLGVLAGCQDTITIPPGAQRVQVVVAGAEVRLEPSTVRAGDVYFVFEPDAATQHVAVAFVHRGGPMDAPIPLSDDDVARLEQDAAPQGLTIESGFGTVHKATLVEGKYAFMLPPEGGQSGVPPLAIAVLEVLP